MPTVSSWPLNANWHRVIWNVVASTSVTGTKETAKLLVPSARVIVESAGNRIIVRSASRTVPEAEAVVTFRHQGDTVKPESGGPTATGVTGALTAMTLHPTTTQTSVETVGYWIFGDPT